MNNMEHNCRAKKIAHTVDKNVRIDLHQPIPSTAITFSTDHHCMKNSS